MRPSDPRSAVAYHVAGAAHGVDQRALEALVDLRAQSGNMNVDHVGLGVEVVVPDMLEQHGPGHDLTRVLHQIFEKPELAWLQDYLGARADDAVRKPVELEVTDAIGGRLPRRGCR